MKLAILGYGNIAESLIDHLENILTEPLETLIILARESGKEKANALIKKVKSNVARQAGVVTSTQALIATQPDLVVECAGHDGVKQSVPLLLSAGIDVVLVSIGAMTDQSLAEKLQLCAKASGAKLILVSGAIGGIDIISSLSIAGDMKIQCTSSKPPLAWKNTNAESLIDLDKLDEANIFFTGTAREAAAQYPKNANVAATLALAGGGFDTMTVSLVADPSLKGNRHEFTVTSAFANITMTIDNKASDKNAKTSMTTVFSILREIRNCLGNMVI